MQQYGYSVEVAEGYDEAVVRARLAFKAEGFGVLSEMHVGGLLGPEADGERQYLIMGVWNAALDERRIGSDLQVAVHLPCNLVVQESGSGAVVAALDPVDATEDPDQIPEAVATAARAAIERVLQRVGSQ